MSYITYRNSLSGNTRGKYPGYVLYVPYRTQPWKLPAFCDSFHRLPTNFHQLPVTSAKSPYACISYHELQVLPPWGRKGRSFSSKIYYRQKSHVQSMLVLLYDIQYMHSCCGLLLYSPEKAPQKQPKTNQRRGAPRLTDKRCARSSFELTTTYSLPRFLLQGVG